MKKENFLKEQTRNRIYEKSNINMSTNGDVIVVDIQPEYENAFTFNLHSFYDFINENYDGMKSLTFLFNGEDTLGMVNENDFKYWMIENGLDENIAYDATYYDKGYAFFRYCMDSGINDEDVADLVKFMVKHDINDSRNMDEEMWELYMSEYNVDQSEVRDLLEYSGDMINIPDLMDFISKYNNIVLCGGGINECLKEVEIALMALDKQYKLLTKYIY